MTQPIPVDDTTWPDQHGAIQRIVITCEANDLTARDAVKMLNQLRVDGVTTPGQLQALLAAGSASLRRNPDTSSRPAEGAAAHVQ